MDREGPSIGSCLRHLSRAGQALGAGWIVRVMVESEAVAESRSLSSGLYPGLQAKESGTILWESWERVSSRGEPRRGVGRVCRWKYTGIILEPGHLGSSPCLVTRYCITLGNY